MGMAELKSYRVGELMSYMETLRVELGERSYPIYIGDNILLKTGELLSKYELSNKIAIISNPTVWRLYGKQLMTSLRTVGYLPQKILIPDGEKYKNLKTIEKIFTHMLKAGIDRNGCVIALGGGVIGDIAGFVAATYMRGIRYVQVPTTLLAQVDASIGGKTGVDHKLGKNLIGAFHQPSFVLSDISTLRTLPEREFRAGLAEVIKYGIIRDKELFRFMEDEKDKVLACAQNSLIYIVKRCSEIKTEIVEKDEREETGLRSILNFGHTIGHAIESATGYKKYLHGEAVAIGMVLETRVSDVLSDSHHFPKVSDLISEYFRFKTWSNIQKDITRFIQYDKKRTGGKIKVFMIKDIGQVNIKNMDILRFKKIINMEV